MTGSASDITHSTYESPDIVALYARPDELQKPEQALLAQIGPALGTMDMLDIGVGGGRTTRHFAPLARTYLGVDYSAAMIARCKLEFPSFRFAVADARRLDFAADESYDLVLFSYNGIDHLDQRERTTALTEMRRLGMVDIACAGNESGDFVPGDDPSLPRDSNPWIYYVSRKPGRV